MIEYRAFQNLDPPQILRLWEECDLGRGAARGFAVDALELLVLGQSYFDPRGLIVAHEGQRLVGFVHAGFECVATGEGLDRTSGVLCAIMVHPEFRRRGIGRSLLARADEYLRNSGATRITAGGVNPTGPFYLGIYGGSGLPGFLESDPLAAPFFGSQGYQPVERRFVFLRDITQKNDPVDFKLMALRRNTQLVISDQPAEINWCWASRYGRFDMFRFLLQPKVKGPPVAEVSGYGMDLYLSTRHERIVGLAGFIVTETNRRKGYGKLLLLDIFRRLREELVTRVEIHAPEGNLALIGLLKLLNFEQVDTGVVYRKGELSG